MLSFWLKGAPCHFIFYSGPGARGMDFGLEVFAGAGGTLSREVFGFVVAGLARLLCGVLTFCPPGRLVAASSTWVRLWDLALQQLHTRAWFGPAGIPQAVRDRVGDLSSDDGDA